MKRIIISLLFIITVLCGYFYEKQKAIVYQKEVNEGLQQYLNERNNDEDRASSHVRKDVIDYTNQIPERREIAPSPLKQLKTQFMQPFKGRAFQELLDMSESLNSILHCDTLDVAQRASILSKITNKPYSEMNALVSEVDRCISECCDSPCFAAIQDSIIYSYSDETLDVYWYYEIQGQDSVLMFDMKSYKRDIGEFDAQTTIDALNERAAKENENAERYFSPDMRYAAFISCALDPYLREQIMAGKGLSKEEYPFINGICLTDLDSSSTYMIVEPGQKVVREHICKLVWNLESDVIYFTSYGDTAGSSGVYSYSLATRKVVNLSDGGVIGLILDEPHIGWLKILNSCFIGDQPGRYWYYAALSPDGETEIRLTEPSINIPED